MFALVEDNKIVKFFNGNKGFTLDGNKYPSSVFSLWSEAERNAINIYTIEIDETNKKDTDWYINTNLTYTFSGGKVTASYGTATAKKMADTLWTSQDKTDGLIPEDEDVGDVAIEGLKTVKKQMINNQCYNLLKDSDWIAVKAQETGATMDSGWKTWRASVRTKCNSMQTQIDNASDVDALAALFTYTYDSSSKKHTRPLGEFPEKE